MSRADPARLPEARRRSVVPRRILRATLGVLLIGTLVAAVSLEADARERWGPFRGRVVDSQTGEPIAGAVMLVVWWELHGVGFIGERFYDAREAVTDADGRFEVPRLEASKWKISVQPPRFHLFAPGYERQRETVTPPDGERFVASTVVPMRRLATREELLSKRRTRPSGVPISKMTEFTRAINAERALLGFEPLPVLPTDGGKP